MNSALMRIREAATTNDLHAIAAIQRAVWNVDEVEIVGPLQLKAAMHAGGSVLIAESDDEALAGFSYAFPAYVDGEIFWHSDMLAVLPAFRGGKLGQRLKWAQRDHAQRHGIKRITWTFDPMQSANAHLNLEWLGVTARHYLPNFYGVTTSDLHHGLPTDRLLASWQLESPRVEALARGEKPAPSNAPEKLIAIPAQWNGLVREDVTRARREQERVAAELQAAFDRDLIITGFDKTSSSYLLTRLERP